MELWERLRRRQIRGFKFVRGYSADFYCPRLQLLIELDGAVHAIQTSADKLRNARLAARSFKTIRIPSWKAFHELEQIVGQIDNEVVVRAKELGIPDTDARETTKRPDDIIWLNRETICGIGMHVCGWTDSMLEVLGVSPSELNWRKALKSIPIPRSLLQKAIDVGRAENLHKIKKTRVTRFR